MNKQLLLAVPIVMTLVLAGCEKEEEKKRTEEKKRALADGLRKPVQQYKLVNGKLEPVPNEKPADKSGADK